MANESRDLKISILSDIEAFDTDPAAADLESLGDAASKTADQIKDNEAAAESAERAFDGVGDSAKDASRDLERVGDSAKDAGDETRDAARDIERAAEDTEQSLESIGDAAKESARETERALEDGKQSVDDFGDRAEQTARKVDSAFDKIAKSSRSNTRKIDDDFDRARKGMDDFKDEAGSTGREAAASFGGGFEDITDTVQEVAANAFAGFGPIGAAAGLAAAAGLGIAVSALEKAAEKANEAKERMVDLADTIREAGGNIDDIDMVGHLEDWNNEIADNKEWWEVWQASNTTNFEMVQKAAEDTGVSISDMLGAMSGTDAEAGAEIMDHYNEKIEEQNRLLEESGELRYEQDGSINAVYQARMKEIDALKENRDLVMDALGLTEEAIEQAEAEAEALAPLIEKKEREAAAAEKQEEAQKRLTEARESAVDIQGEFVDAQDAFTDAVEESADKHSVSVEQINENLREQQESFNNWADNIAELARRGVEEGVLAELADMGPEAAPMVAALTEASEKELTEWVTLMGGKGTEGARNVIQSVKDGQPGMRTAGAGLGQSAADGFEGKTGAVESAARGVHRAAQNVLDAPLNVDVNVNGPSRQQLWAVRSTISNGIGTITVPVAPGTLRASGVRYRP